MPATTLLLLTSCLLTVTTATSRNNVDKKRFQVHFSEQTPEELRTIFNSSITYWDIDNSDLFTPEEKYEAKRYIMEDLVHVKEYAVSCGCPRTIRPFVCANDGQMYHNVCKFHCKFADKENEGILPVMIFDVSRSDEANAQCKLWYKKTFETSNPSK